MSIDTMTKERQALDELKNAVDLSQLHHVLRYLHHNSSVSENKLLNKEQLENLYFLISFIEAIR